MTYYIESMNEEDVETMVQYGLGFWQLTPYKDDFSYNPESVRDLLYTMADQHYVRVAHSDKGHILGFIAFWLAPMIFNQDISTATEIFFFVHPVARGAGLGEELLDHSIKELEPIVDIMSLGDMATSMHMEELYKRKGFELGERTYTKAL